MAQPIAQVMPDTEKDAVLGFVFLPEQLIKTIEKTINNDFKNFIFLLLNVLQIKIKISTLLIVQLIKLSQICC